MLRMLLNRVFRKIDQANVDSQTEMRAAFATRYREIFMACCDLQSVINLPPGQLARRYMSSVLSERRNPSWWHENAIYLSEAWFIYEYGCDNNLIMRQEKLEPAKNILSPIIPEKTAHDGFIKMHLARKAGNPECGRIALEYTHADDLFRQLALSMKFENMKECWVRSVDETGGGIHNRAVETAVKLLQNGYRVCTDEPSLKERILEEDYAPEHMYWVIEGSDVDKLELRYPRDRQLHGYVYKAGGRWNGKTVEISVCNSHLLDDLIRLYGFRVTRGARTRMDAWLDALEQATIYRSRKRKDAQNEMQMVDRFKEMMDRRSKRIDDLYEDDE